MIAIFNIEKEAIEFSDKIHIYLLKNRKKYNADKWSNLNKSDSGKFAVSIPIDYDKYTDKLDVDNLEIVEKLPIDWKIIE